MGWEGRVKTTYYFVYNLKYWGPSLGMVVHTCAGSLKKVDQKFKAILNYTAKLCLKSLPQSHHTERTTTTKTILTQGGAIRKLALQWP